ncbi:hypothetical protein FJT64_008597 [Amphibalanus amphitrite]|uniref:Uncharacterized protein n=1 Tax=Amphibalanus amphitrite TaxID=1232801 RepID=A0A6A4VKU9_AMPAM|nr:hypothetical protein FJT64_008597 [Amphibalanus amphitrite]
MLDISEPGLVDMKGKGMHDENHNYPRSDFNTCQFITVIIKSGEETRINVDVAHDFASIKSNFDDTVEMWMANDLECQYGMHVYIGEGAVGKMRTESISSLVNNEPEGYRPVLRSRTNELDIIGMAGWTLSFSGGPATVRKSMQFKFTVSFLDRPEDKLSVEKKNRGKFVGAVAEAQKMIQKAVHKNAILIVAVLVLGLIMLASAYGYRRFQQEKTDEQAPDPEGSKEESQGSSSSDDDSDSSDSSD